MNALFSSYAVSYTHLDVYKRQDKDEKWTKIINGMTIYKDTQLKAYLEQVGFHEVQIHKKKGWLCVTARK